MLEDIQNPAGYNSEQPAVADLSSEWFHTQLNSFNKVKHFLPINQKGIYLKQKRMRFNLLVCIVMNLKIDVLKATDFPNV